MNSIPKIIHQTWKSLEIPNPQLERCVESLRSQGGWEHRFRDDSGMEEDVASCNMPRWIRAFREAPAMIHKADIWRLVALWRWGGVYADIDIWMIRPLDELLSYLGEPDGGQLIWVADHPLHAKLLYGGKQMVMNDFMIAPVGCQFVANVLDRISFNIEKRVPGDVVQITGPGALTQEADASNHDARLLHQIIPSSLIHPLPDMTVNWGSRRYYATMWKLIADGGWREKYNPFAAHLWWHCYHSDQSLITMFGDKIFQ